MVKDLKISVITPSYNQGQFLDKTISSVLSQEGDFIIDYIIVDGASQDNSVEIIKKYDQLVKENKWPIKCRGITYRWLSEKDDGQIEALEKGFAMADGDIGGWLNSDDLLSDNNVLAKVSQEFLKNPSLDVLTGDGNLINAQGKIQGIHHVDNIDLTEAIYLDYHIFQPGSFVTKKVYKEEHLLPEYNYCFDAEFFIRLIVKGYNVKKTNEVYASFRVYPENKTSSGANARYLESLNICKLYGKNNLHYSVARIYRYWDMVLRSKYPSNKLIWAFTMFLRAVSYRIILNKWWR